MKEVGDGFEMFNILYDVNLDIAQLLTKSNKTYLRVRYPDFHPKQIIESIGKEYSATRKGSSSLLAFVNKNTVVVTTWDWSVYKRMHKKEFDNPVKKEITKKWRSLPWKTKYMPGQQKLVFKLKKNGEPCVMFFSRWTNRRKKTHKQVRYLKLKDISLVVNNFVCRLSGHKHDILSFNSPHIAEYTNKQETYKRLAEMIVSFALGNLKK